jgi:coenzyme F420-reducing hydrogenase beta subunit
VKLKNQVDAVIVTDITNTSKPITQITTTPEKLFGFADRAMLEYMDG